MKAGRLLVLLLALFIVSCQKEDSEPIAPQKQIPQNYLTAFNFLRAANPQLTTDLIGTINKQKITFQIPAGLPFTKLIASFTNTAKSKVYLGNTEQVSGKIKNNFSHPNTYQVIAPVSAAKYFNLKLNPVFPELDEALEKLRQQYHIPGLAVAIVKNEKLVFAKGYGFANQETRQPVHNQSLFRIASLSKPITAVAILKLVQAGKLTLTAKVFGQDGILKNSYGLVPPGSNVENITVQNLLEHKSGWTNQPTDPMMVNSGFSYQELIADMVQNRALTYAPGTNFYYSNFGYCVLGRIIEKVSGKSYAAYVQSEILNPLGIIDMRLADNLPQQSAFNEVTYYQAEDNPYAYNIRRMDAHGGWLATATDLMRLMIHIDRNTKAVDIISNDLLNRTYLGYYNWNHTGSFPGTSAILSRLDDEYSFAVLANTRNNNQPFQITEAFHEAIKNQILLKTKWPEADLFTQNMAGSQ